MKDGPENISKVSFEMINLYQLLTAPSHLENGRPLSRAKANVCRDVDASELIVIMVRSTSTTIVRPVVAPMEPVAF